MNEVDLAFASALEQAELIRNREVSPLELVELYLKRIQRLDEQLGSYFTVMAELAIADALLKTEQLAQIRDTSELPPFFGVPISIKDLHPVAGVRCSYGVSALQNQATEDDGVVAAIKQAGFIILGKTATSELGSLPYTEPTGFPPTRNPWNLQYTAGGSSGGAAAAVAAGLCAIAQGSDAGGSIRGPACCCGLVGIKPSRGRVSAAPVGDLINGIATIGPLARTVADAAALLDVISGYKIGDPYWLPDPEPSFLVATTQKLSPLRVAFITNIIPFGEADCVCRQAVLETAQLLQALGHTVEPGDLNLADLIAPFTTIWRAGVAYSGVPQELLQPFNQWLLAQTSSVGDYLRAVAQMQVIARQIVADFDSVDVLVLPTYLHATIRVGEWAALSPEETLEKIIGWVAPCPPFNATGQPAITIPIGFDSKVPVGVQLVGRPAAEVTLITLAAQLEAAKPWIQNRPAFAA